MCYLYTNKMRYLTKVATVEEYIARSVVFLCCFFPEQIHEI